MSKTIGGVEKLVAELREQARVTSVTLEYPIDELIETKAASTIEHQLSVMKDATEALELARIWWVEGGESLNGLKFVDETIAKLKALSHPIIGDK